MLKRQRPSSPIPSSDCPVAERAIDVDILERLTKRRRHFAPPRYTSTTKNAQDSQDSSDDEEDREESPGSSSFARGLPHWQAEAGVYKAANTLLHDLHAEQRHRLIFSPPSTTPHVVSRSSHSPSRTSDWTPPSRTDSAVLHMGHVAPHPTGPAKITPPPYPETMVDEMEAKHVTQRYEDTNRLLGSLFLDRRNRLESER